MPTLLFIVDIIKWSNWQLKFKCFFQCCSLDNVNVSLSDINVSVSHLYIYHFFICDQISLNIFWESKKIQFRFSSVTSQIKICVCEYLIWLSLRPYLFSRDRGFYITISHFQIIYHRLIVFLFHSLHATVAVTWHCYWGWNKNLE